MTGHGGDEFEKFQDMEEINTLDIVNAFMDLYNQQYEQKWVFNVWYL